MAGSIEFVSHVEALHNIRDKGLASSLRDQGVPAQGYRERFSILMALYRGLTVLPRSKDREQARSYGSYL